jgi:glutathione synthase
MYTDGNLAWTPAPLSLSPSAYPAESFNYLKQIQNIWNILIDRISRDRVFVINELENITEADEFTGRLLKLYQEIPEEILHQQIQLGIFRSDYMLPEKSKNEQRKPLQVEINTIASGLGSLSHKHHQFLRHFLLKYQHHPHIQYILSKTTSNQTNSANKIVDQMMDNNAEKTIIQAMAYAHNLYLKKYYSPSSSIVHNICILFVVQPNERNVSSLFLLFYK